MYFTKVLYLDSDVEELRSFKSIDDVILYLGSIRERFSLISLRQGG